MCVIHTLLSIFIEQNKPIMQDSFSNGFSFNDFHSSKPAAYGLQMGGLTN